MVDYYHVPPQTRKVSRIAVSGVYHPSKVVGVRVLAESLEAIYSM